MSADNNYEGVLIQHISNFLCKYDPVQDLNTGHFTCIDCTCAVYLIVIILSTVTHGPKECELL